MNHLVTDSILAISGLSTLGSSVHLVLKLASLMKDGSRNKSGCSAQYCENSDKETGDRINGGATKEDRSPLKVETDFKKEVHAEELAYPDIILEALEIGLFYLFIIIMFSGGKLYQISLLNFQEIFCGYLVLMLAVCSYYLWKPSYYPKVLQSYFRKKGFSFCESTSISGARRNANLPNFQYKETILGYINSVLTRSSTIRNSLLIDFPSLYLVFFPTSSLSHSLTHTHIHAHAVWG